MRIQPNAAATTHSIYMNKVTGHVISPAHEANIKALSQDIFEFNNGPEAYVTYTSEGLPAYSVHGVDISGGKPMTDDEKWAAIQKKYAGVPMFEKVYVQMILDMSVSGLITKDEASAACGHVESISSIKDIVYDMEDGIMGNDPTPTSFFLLDFNELFSDVSDESKEYAGYNSRNDQRTFLKSFYTKMLEIQKQNTEVS